MSRKYFFNGETLNNKIYLKNEEYHHLSKVMRAKEGDNIVLTNGKGIDYHSVITLINKDTIVLDILETIENDNENLNPVLVCVGLMKGDKNELVIQKCAELGVSKLLFFESEYCIAKAKENKLERYQKISLEASKQSGRSTIMEILPTCTLKNLPNVLKDYSVSFCAYEKGGKSLKTYDFNSYNNIALIVGSEGGFSQKEIDYLSEKSNTQIISLGKRILRAETACITLTSLIMYELGELQ